MEQDLREPRAQALRIGALARVSDSFQRTMLGDARQVRLDRQPGAREVGVATSQFLPSMP